MVTRSFTLIAAACLVTAAFAYNTVSPVRMPDNVSVKHVYVTVGPDGIGRVDGGVTIQQISAKLPLYSLINEEVEGSSGYYFPTGEAWADGIPILGPAVINEIKLWYYANATGTFNLDLVLYDTTNQLADIYNMGCAGWVGLALGAYNITGLPMDPNSSWIVTIDVSTLPTLANGRIWCQYQFSNSAVGLVLMNGGDAAPLGRYVQYTGKTVIPVQGSPTNSENVMVRLSDNGCYWFGGNPRANKALAFAGRYAFRGRLTGAYGAPGGAVAFPMNTCYVTVIDGAGVAETNLVYLYAETPSGGYKAGNQFSLPFNTSGPYTIRVERFNGYLSRSVGPITIDVTGLTTTADFPLRVGDVNYDNTVNILDFNAVLGNFGASGN